jgi:hypothetical protein
MSSVFESVKGCLHSTDDQELWEVVLKLICDHVRNEAARADTTRDVVLIVGACSAWLRPHQTRFRVGRLEFAWPSGYGGTQYSRTGLPLYDWCRCFLLDRNDEFSPIDLARPQDRRRLLFRVTLPTKTMRRWKAAIHTIWLPGVPRKPRQPIVWLLGYNRRRGKGDWELRGSHRESGRHWTGPILPIRDRTPCASSECIAPVARVVPDDTSHAELRI